MVDGAGEGRTGRRRGARQDVSERMSSWQAVTRSYSKAAMASRSRRAISVKPSRSLTARAVRVVGSMALPSVGRQTKMRASSYPCAKLASKS